MTINKYYRHKKTQKAIHIFFRRPSSLYGFYYVIEDELGHVTALNEKDFNIESWEEISCELFNEIKEIN